MHLRPGFGGKKTLLKLQKGKLEQTRPCLPLPRISFLLKDWVNKRWCSSPGAVSVLRTLCLGMSSATPSASMPSGTMQSTSGSRTLDASRRSNDCGNKCCSGKICLSWDKAEDTRPSRPKGATYRHCRSTTIATNQVRIDPDFDSSWIPLLFWRQTQRRFVLVGKQQAPMLRRVMIWLRKNIPLTLSIIQTKVKFSLAPGLRWQAHQVPESRQRFPGQSWMVYEVYVQVWSTQH